MNEVVRRRCALKHLRDSRQGEDAAARKKQLTKLVQTHAWCRESHSYTGRRSEEI